MTPTTTKKLSRSNEWRYAVIKFISQRDGYRCHYCRQTFTDHEFVEDPSLIEIDHVNSPVTKDDYSDPNNLVLACRDCNGNKSDGSYEDAILHGAIKAARRDPEGRQAIVAMRNYVALVWPKIVQTKER